MSTPTEKVLDALKRLGRDPKRSGNGQYTCRCPAHEDQNPSLSIGTSVDGCALVNCHAGCETKAVLDALGLSEADLFEQPTKQNGQRAKGFGSGDTRGLKPRTFATAEEAALGHGMGSKPSKTWTYTNAEGEPVGVVCRWDGPKGKEIRPVSRTGSGWVLTGMDEPRPLYNLPGVIGSSGRVFVVEGEKAAEALGLCGVVATTSPHGSKSAKKADWSPLAGREVVILPDHDDAGLKYAKDVAQILATLSPAPTVRVIELPGLPDGGDVVEFLEARGGDVDAVRAEIENLVDNAEPMAPDRPTPAAEAFEPFPVEALPELFRRYVTDGAKAIGCDPSYVALPLLSAAASAIGNSRRIELKRGWSEPAIIWTGIIGESGTTKSPALELAWGPIRDRQSRTMREHGDAMKAYEKERMKYERELAAWRKSKEDGDPPEPPEVPTADRCWTDDATTEALAVLLQQNPRGLLMSRDELAGWLGGFDRYASGKGDAAKWLEMFGGRPMVVDRKTSGTIYVPAAAVSIAGGIQPDILRKALGTEHRENGLAARMLMAWPPRRPKQWTEADIDPDNQRSVKDVFNRLYELNPSEGDDGEPRPVLLRLSDKAKRVWIDFYNAHNVEQLDHEHDLSAAWSKLEGYAPRFALVIHCVRVASGELAPYAPKMVDEMSMAAGIKLARWFGQESKRIYAMLDESDEQADRRKLVEWIQRQGGTVSARELSHGLRRYRREPDAAGDALADLVAQGYGNWVHSTPGPEGGRPSQRFALTGAGTVTGTETPNTDP